MFTSQHFSLNESELRNVLSDFGDEKGATAAFRAALKRAESKIVEELLSVDSARVDLLRGAALILHDISAILDRQISAEVARRRKPDQPADRRFEV